MTWGADSKTAADSKTVKSVNIIRHTRSRTIAANFHSFSKAEASAWSWKFYFHQTIITWNQSKSFYFSKFDWLNMNRYLSSYFIRNNPYLPQNGSQFCLYSFLVIWILINSSVCSWNFRHWVWYCASIQSWLSCVTIDIQSIIKIQARIIDWNWTTQWYIS